MLRRIARRNPAPGAAWRALRRSACRPFRSPCARLSRTSIPDERSASAKSTSKPTARDLVAIEQLPGQTRELVARPRPAAFLRKARFVDVDNDDLRVALLRKRELQARVVRDRLELAEEGALAEFGQGRKQENGDDDQRDQPSRRSRSVARRVRAARRCTSQARSRLEPAARASVQADAYPAPRAPVRAAPDRLVRRRASPRSVHQRQS